MMRVDPPDSATEELDDLEDVRDDEYLARCLDERAPSDILDSDQLLHSFRRFFLRGTSNDLWNIAPATLRPTGGRSGRPASQAVSRQHSPATPARNNSEAANAEKLSAAPSSSGSTKSRRRRNEISKSGTATPPDKSRSDTVDDRIAAFFSSRVSNPTRLHALARVTRGCIEAKRLPPQTLHELWGVQNNVFSASSTSESRFARLYRGRKQIEQNQTKFECASRLSLIFLAHDIEITKSRPFKLQRGQCRQQFAVLWLAEHLGVAADEIKEDWRRAQSYMKILEACGPGSLLELGASVSWYWEKSITREDVDLWLECRRTFLPELEERAKKLNKIAAQAILNGMAAYGWTVDDFAGLEVTTRLQKALTRHCSDLINLPWNCEEDDSSHVQTQKSSTTEASNHADPQLVANKNSYAQQLCLEDSADFNADCANPNQTSLRNPIHNHTISDPAASQFGAQFGLVASGLDAPFSSADLDSLPDWTHSPNLFGEDLGRTPMISTR